MQEQGSTLHRFRGGRVGEGTVRRGGAGGGRVAAKTVEDPLRSKQVTVLDLVGSVATYCCYRSSPSSTRDWVLRPPEKKAHRQQARSSALRCAKTSKFLRGPRLEG
ncbi:hypothetical protein MTO96_044220 [Rhipicephalus appendiculatus]